MTGLETSIRNEVKELKEEIDANEYLVRDVDKRVKKIHHNVINLSESSKTQDEYLDYMDERIE